MALYDLDAFRSHFFSNEIETDDFNEEDINAAKQDDMALLRVAFSWIKQNLFLKTSPDNIWCVRKKSKYTHLMSFLGIFKSLH